MKFNKDIGEFVRVYKMLDDDFCDQCVVEIEKSHESFQQHVFYNSIDRETKNRSGDKELWVSWNSLPQEHFDKVMQSCWNMILQYQTDLDLGWWMNWNDFEHFRVNRYEDNQQMALHCDHIHSLFDGTRQGVPILTVLFSFNDSYEGGDFMLWDTPIKLNKGEVIMFPSNFVYPHKVEPVTSGVRYTGVTWVW